MDYMKSTCDTWFIDDQTYEIVAPAASIIDKSTSVARVILDEYFLFQLPINFSPKKTAMLPFTHGERSEEVKRHLFNSGPVHVKVVYTGGTAHVPIIDKYKHAGTLVSCNLSIGTEVTIKTAIVHSTARQFKRKLLSNDNIACEKRMYIANSLVFSRIAHNTGVWPRLNDSNAARFHSTFYRHFAPLLAKIAGRL